MSTTLWLLLASVAAWFVFKHIRVLGDNIQKAKQSGLPYKIVPILIMKRLWHEAYSPFALVGAETFLAVSSTGITLWTCEPEAIMQISHRGRDFPKSMDVIEILNMFGPTLTATEGEEARLYKRVAAGAMTESMHRNVWRFTLEAAAHVMQKWLDPRMNGLVKSPRNDIQDMALHILSYCAYGWKMEWDEDDADDARKLSAFHTLTYTNAMRAFLKHATTIFLTPQAVLKHSPLAVHKQAYEAFVEMKRYMEEMRDGKQAELSAGASAQDQDLLGRLVSSSKFAGNPSMKAREPGNDAEDNGSYISQEAVLGNIFIFILAGHHTTANVVETALTLLACFPKLQQTLQHDLDSILGDTAVSDWSYDNQFPKLMAALPGAIMNEVLRLYTVIPFFPKETLGAPQTINLKGRQTTIPAQTLININTNAAHRNPNVWPNEKAGARKFESEAAPYPVSAFDPGQWLGKSSSDTSSASPVPGSYVPFGEGTRSCMGTRFAKTEFIAWIARTFKDYSVELDVPPPADGHTREQTWKMAQEECVRELSEGVIFYFALKMEKGVSVRIVKRGQEAWRDMR